MNISGEWSDGLAEIALFVSVLAARPLVSEQLFVVLLQPSELRVHRWNGTILSTPHNSRAGMKAMMVIMSQVPNILWTNLKEKKERLNNLSSGIF